MMSKKAIVPLLVLLGGGLFFYLVNKPTSVPATPVVPSSTSTPAASAATSSVPAASSSEPAPVPAPASSPQEPSQKPKTSQEPRIKIGTADIAVELARTSAEVEKGLSGRLSLPPDKGMLFLFPQAAMYRFWMPDMHFPIDIIWISSDKKVVSVSANVSNEFDPANPKFYTPAAPAQYVLETNTGFAARMGIKAGSSVAFTNIPTK